MSSKRVRKVANKMLSSIPHLYYISILSIFFLHTLIKCAFLSLDKNHQQSHPN